jgi:hypothetical protein
MQAEPLPEERQLKLLTALELQQILLQIFEDYRNSRKPGFLIDKPVTDAPVHSDDEFFYESQDEPKSTHGVFSTVGSFFKSAAALAFEHGTRKHSTLTKFITEEVADILNQRGASALKIMTDLTILFQGLQLHMRSTHSVTLSPLLDNVNRMIWPYKGREDSRIVFDLDSQIRISKDYFDFLYRFKFQIDRARKLISHNTTLSDKSNTAGLRNPVNPLFAVDHPEWQYRCSEVGSYDEHKAPAAWMGEAYRAFLSNDAPLVNDAERAPNSNYRGID